MLLSEVIEHNIDVKLYSVGFMDWFTLEIQKTCLLEVVCINIYLVSDEVADQYNVDDVIYL